MKRLSGLFLVSFLLLGCVGPTTPFGALEEVKEVEVSKNKKKARDVASQNRQKYQVFFHPSRQVLHDKADFSVELKSEYPIQDGVEIQVIHNNIDVTESFLSSARVHRSQDLRTRIYILENFRLKTLDTNKIQVRVLRGEENILLEKPLQAPDCSLFQKRQLAHLGTFRAPEEYIGMIEKVAGEHDSNPSFLAGIVAQESGFNPQAVSWAKAIGLTQITPLAEKEVLNSIDDWPRYPGINTLSYLSLKAKIHTGEITEGEEWRLDPMKSLKGGMTYIGYLKRYWNLKKNKKIVDSLKGDRERNLTELILASYNSGASRVKRAVKEMKDDWKNHENLKEAVNYVKKVSSYCFHYTDSDKKEVQDVDET